MPSFRPFYLTSGKCKLFSLIVLPDENIDLSNSKTFIFVPPMMDEMNKSRPIFIRQAKRLANIGHHVLIFDLFGTGDSEGDHKDISLAIWRQNVLDVIKWSKESGYKNIVLWGLRSGCLFIADLLCELDESIDKLLFWQPILEGSLVSKQIQRLGVARSISSGVEDNTKPDASFPYVDVSGYQLDKNFLEDIKDISLKKATMSKIKNINWAQVNVIESGVNPGHQNIIDLWTNIDINVNYATTVNDLFWVTPEVSIPDSLIDLTTKWYL